MQTRLREIMEEKGMKSVELAERLGVTKQTISNLINGRVMPSIDTIGKAADVLGVPMWQMFASREDVVGSQPCDTDGPVIKCDKCGNIIRLKVEQ